MITNIIVGIVIFAMFIIALFLTFITNHDTITRWLENHLDVNEWSNKFGKYYYNHPNFERYGIVAFLVPVETGYVGVFKFKNMEQTVNFPMKKLTQAKEEMKTFCDRTMREIDAIYY